MGTEYPKTLEQQARRSLYLKQYRQDHKEERRLYKQQYRRTHKIQTALYAKHYQRKHLKALEAYSCQWRQKVKAEVLGYYSLNGFPQCVQCGITDIDVLCIDHANNDGKQHRAICGLRIYQWLRRNNYPEGYQTLCFNCNRKKEVLRRRDDADRVGNKG